MDFYIGFFGDEIRISNFNMVSDFWILEALTKKRNVPTLDGDDLDTDSDPGSVRPNLLELVTNARSENPQTQLDAIQCMFDILPTILVIIFFSCS